MSRPSPTTTTHAIAALVHTASTGLATLALLGRTLAAAARWATERAAWRRPLATVPSA
jgi:hypothetical protein